MLEYARIINFIVTDDGLKLVGVKVTSNVLENLHEQDKETWKKYLGLIDDAVREETDMSKLSPE